MGANVRVRKHKCTRSVASSFSDGNGPLGGRSLRVFKSERAPPRSPGDKTCSQISVLSTWARLVLVPASLLRPLAAYLLPACCLPAACLPPACLPACLRRALSIPVTSLAMIGVRASTYHSSYRPGHVLSPC